MNSHKNIILQKNNSRILIYVIFNLNVHGKNNDMQSNRLHNKHLLKEELCCEQGENLLSNQQLLLMGQ